jgi:hypothetical protein
MTKQKAISELVKLGCKIVDPLKGQSSVKVITPNHPNQVAIANPADLLIELSATADSQPTHGTAQEGGEG